MIRYSIDGQNYTARQGSHETFEEALQRSVRRHVGAFVAWHTTARERGGLPRYEAQLIHNPRHNGDGFMAERGARISVYVLA